MNISSPGSYVFRIIAPMVAVLLVAAPVDSQAQNKRALLIAIDEYQRVSDLSGTGNDVDLMRSVLVGKFNFPPENILVLKDRQATRDGILSAIRTHLIEPTEAGDIVVLHYSGHGSQMRDVSGDEIDGYDETIVPHDARTPGVFDISDDELNAVLSELGQKTDNVTVIFDSCNSGSATRGAVARTVPPDTRQPPPSDLRGAGADGAAMRPPSAKYVLISGARSDEFANETRFGGKTYGAMTYHLGNALLTAGPSVTYREIMDSVRSRVTASFATQHPQLEGAGMDAVVFGDKSFLTTPYVLVDPDGSRRVTVAAGIESGLSEGSELDVFAPGTRDFNAADAVGRIRITSANVGRAKGRVIEGGRVPAQSRATLDGRTFGDFVLPVWIDESIDRRMREQIRDALGDLESVELIGAEADARVRVMNSGDTIALQSADEVELSPPVSTGDEDAVEHVAMQVTEWSRWYSLLDLGNPNPSFDIDLHLRRQDDPVDAPMPETITAGTKVAYTVTNNSDETIYIYSLVLSADGSVAVLYPSQEGAEEGLPPGETFEQTGIEPFVPQGRDSIRDVLKVIATSTAINPAIFPQDAVRGVEEEIEVSSDPLERLLANASLGATRGLKTSPDPVSLGSWATSQVMVQTRLPVSKLVSFAVHTDTVADGGTRSAATRTLCGPGAAPAPGCVEATALSADDNVYEVAAGATRGGVRDIFSPGQSFQDAYELRDELGAARVEPLIEADVSNNNDLVPGTRSSGGDDPHDLLAAADDTWSLKYVVADDARRKVREKQGSGEGSEAAGILIAHPDTGYRRHPEVWDEVNGQRPVRNDAGVDYIDGDDDAFDPLDDSALISHPGHGVASGSVIVSPAGCQLEGSDDCVYGVAPGAQLVPLRVHTSVVLLNQGNLVKAINDIANNNLDVETPMVSIAMGGPPTWALWKAVRRAEKNGKLIISAAGNNVGTVVWPARFDSTIAVAAVNIRCVPWRGSSRGSAVDIAAPGESVWRATVDKDTKMDAIGMGRGTTFATGTTAGSAALWIAYHSGEPEFEQLVSNGKVLDAFRQAVSASSWRPDVESDRQPAVMHCREGTNWNDRKYGAGIVNASALLDQPLTVSSTRSVHAATIAELPLIDSLYPRPSNAANVVADYRRLFSIEDDVDLETIAYFESEIAFHYASDEQVRNRYDAIIDGARDDADFAMLRDALLAQDLSPRLRDALTL